MLGELIDEERGKTTGIRVLPEGKVEASFQGSGKILGVEYSNIGTYVSSPKLGGLLQGEGQGVSMTKDGDAISWTGSGIGRPTGKGWGASWRGVLYFQTASQKLARLNGIVGIFEYEIDENGNQVGKIWEWK